MVFGYNPNDPMCHSVYMESPIPTIEEIVNGQTPDPLQYATPVNPNGPRLAPQPTRDGYYSSDGVDDGRISTFEKLKAFVKGGTYNMVRGLFCDKNGFSLGRTLASAAGIAAVALTGPVGLAVASGLGLICAVDNFNNSMHKAKYAVTDQQAREAYEGFGESATTAGLSLWGGFKSFKAIKAKFFKPKPTPQPQPQPQPAPQPTPPSSGATPTPTPSGATPAPSGATPTPTPSGTTPAPTGATPSPSAPTPVRTTPPPSGTPAPINAEGFFNEWAPTGDIPPKAPPTKIQRHEFIPDWKPTGEIPKPTSHPYVNEWAPTGNTPKPTSHPYFNEYTPTGDIPPTAPTGNPVAPRTPNVDAILDNNNHFFG